MFLCFISKIPSIVSLKVLIHFKAHMRLGLFCVLQVERLISLLSLFMHYLQRRRSPVRLQTVAVHLHIWNSRLILFFACVLYFIEYCNLLFDIVGSHRAPLSKLGSDKRILFKRIKGDRYFLKHSTRAKLACSL